MSFSMETRHIENVDKIMTLLEEIEARDINPGNRRAVIEAAE
jgi:hypothetical protein